MPSLINSDDGVVSGSAGLKTTGGNDGILVFQSSGTETARITSGVLAVSATSTTASTVRLYEDTDNGSNYVDLIAPTSVASNRTITLPDSTGTVVVGSAAVSAVGQIPFSTDGTSYTPTAKIVSGTAITLTNQTAPAFTGIPSWVKRITVMLSGVSTNGSGQILIQLGDSGGYETSGYSGATGYNSSFVNYSSGFNFDTASSVAATTVRHGAMVLTLVGSNTWVVHGTGALSSAAGSFYFGGSKTLSDTLTSVRLYIDGTQQFDAGTLNILYE